MVVKLHDKNCSPFDFHLFKWFLWSFVSFASFSAKTGTACLVFAAALCTPSVVVWPILFGMRCGGNHICSLWVFCRFPFWRDKAQHSVLLFMSVFKGMKNPARSGKILTTSDGNEGFFPRLDDTSFCFSSATHSGLIPQQTNMEQLRVLETTSTGRNTNFEVKKQYESKRAIKNPSESTCFSKHFGSSLFLAVLRSFAKGLTFSGFNGKSLLNQMG